ncbi:sigma-70 family RNA polymerase sigma factor [Streptomyces sp. NPDC090088]|uniref:sigma-70 family RNA polymerase sigma factor n=1 Tax=Streptomyces sp. NPDC090088 TaxID=3365944 RepID=UPI003830660A
MRKASGPPTAVDTAARLSGTDLVNAARSGDTHAQAALFDEYLPLIYNVIGRGLHGHPDVDDAVQETMLRALRALPRLREPERFRSWIVAIAIRQIHDHGRRRKAALVRQAPLTEADDLPDAGADFAEVTVDRQTLADAGGELLEASRWLSDDQRRTMALWWQEAAGQLSRKEVAEALDLSVPHTAVRIQRMKARLELAVRVLAAWRARPRCPGLDSATGGGSAAPGAGALTRLGRHVTDCPSCQAAATWDSIDNVPIRLGGLAVPAVLAAGIPGLVARHGVASGLLSSLWHALQHGAGRLVPAKTTAAVGATVTLAAVTGLAIQQYAPSPHHTTPATPGTSPTAVASAARLPGPAPSAAGETPSATPAHAYSGLSTADHYVAPDGDDANPGTLTRPFATVTHAVAEARPGQTVAVRGGTYRPGTTVALKASGTADHRIVVSNYRDERPVFDGSRLASGTWFLVQSGAYVTVQGIEIVHAPDVAYACGSCHDNAFTRLSVHDNGRIGLLLHGAGTTGNTVLDSDFFANHETGSTGGRADGLLFQEGSGTGNRIQGCRVYDNSGDGLDVSSFVGAVTIDRTWAFGNGVNHWGTADFAAGGSGFKLGGGTTAQSAQTVTDSAAWDNAGFGFTELGTAGAPTLTHDTAYRNGAAGFAFVHMAATLKANLAVANKPDSWLGSAASASGNSWDQQGWTAADLRLTDTAATTAPRRADGSLPRTLFLSNTRDASTGATMS